MACWRNLERSDEVVTLDDPFHQIADSCALVSLRRNGFPAPLYSRG